MRKLTTDEFIQRARTIHGNRYDYSKVCYKSSTTKIKILCFEHGCFQQQPACHINQKQGCPKCGLEFNASVRRKSSAGFIKDAKTVHGKTYDYSLVEYRSALKKVKIICKSHGIFEQTAASHLEGRGCCKCWGLPLDTKTFIRRAKAVHGDKYAYHSTLYADGRPKSS